MRWLNRLFNRGGAMPAPSTNGDLVSARLSPGEVRCPTCDWGAASYNEDELMAAWLQHADHHDYRVLNVRSETTMDDLIAFLKARLDEDEEVALETRKSEQFVYGTDRWFASHNNAITSMAPHRAVAVCEAKRRIIDRATSPTSAISGQTERQDFQDGWNIAFDCVLRELASPYAGHPDYRQEWKP